MGYRQEALNTWNANMWEGGKEEWVQDQCELCTKILRQSTLTNLLERKTEYKFTFRKTPLEDDQRWSVPAPLKTSIHQIHRSHRKQKCVCVGGGGDGQRPLHASVAVLFVRWGLRNIKLGFNLLEVHKLQDGMNEWQMLKSQTYAIKNNKSMFKKSSLNKTKQNQKNKKKENFKTSWAFGSHTLALGHGFLWPRDVRAVLSKQTLQTFIRPAE